MEISKEGLDDWQGLRAFTQARIALGSTGYSLRTHQMLAIKKATSLARDAVHSKCDFALFQHVLASKGHAVVELQSQATHRETYLLRPDLGRALDSGSIAKLSALSKPDEKHDLSIVIADGLSASAVQQNGLPFLTLFFDAIGKRYSLSPISLVVNGRVAIADQIGAAWGAKATIVLIGERPGLTASESLGIYYTFGPQIGNTDEKRNCISNIRPKGLGYEAAVAILVNLIENSFLKGLSGVGLKDELGPTLSH